MIGEAETDAKARERVAKKVAKVCILKWLSWEGGDVEERNPK